MKKKKPPYKKDYRKNNPTSTKNYMIVEKET